MKSMKRKLCAALLSASMVLSLPGIPANPVSVKAAGKIRLNKTNATIKVGGTVKLKVKGTIHIAKYSSSNTSVCKVGRWSGLVKGQKKGKAVITAKVAGKKLKCKVKVKAASKTTVVIKNTKVPVTTKPAQTPSVTGSPSASAALPASSAGLTSFTPASNRPIATGNTVVTMRPSVVQTPTPTLEPTPTPTLEPTPTPTLEPTPTPTLEPTPTPTLEPTPTPTPTLEPTPTPTLEPTPTPTLEPTPTPVWKPTSISIQGASSVLAPGGTMQLEATFSPEGTTGEVEWSSSATYIAKVSEDGKVEGVGIGEATITARLSIDGELDWDVYGTYNVTVKDVSAEVESVGGGDGGDIILTNDDASAAMTYTVSDTVSDVSVNVLDALGDTVKSEEIGKVTADTEMDYTWDLTNDEGERVSAGTYCFEIVAAGASKSSEYFTVYAKSDFSAGSGSVTSPYEVKTIDDFKKVAAHNGVNFKQVADLDAGMDALQPMYTTDAPFTGLYDGNGYVIRNVQNNLTGDYIGLFGAVGKGGTVQNMTVEDSFINGTNRVAVLVGHNYGTILNCKVKSCNVLASGYNAAALVANNSGMLKQCSTENNIVRAQSSDNNGKAGAICAWTEGNIMECISLSDQITGVKQTGGITAYNNGNIISCIVKESAITTSETYWGYKYLGGIAAVNDGTINSCSVSSVKFTSANSEKVHLGGIIGENTGNYSSNVMTDMADVSKQVGNA